MGRRAGRSPPSPSQNRGTHGRRHPSRSWGHRPRPSHPSVHDSACKQRDERMHTHVGAHRRLGREVCGCVRCVRCVRSICTCALYAREQPDTRRLWIFEEVDCITCCCVKPPGGAPPCSKEGVVKACPADPQHGADIAAGERAEPHSTSRWRFSFDMAPGKLARPIQPLLCDQILSRPAHSSQGSLALRMCQEVKPGHTSSSGTQRDVAWCALASEGARPEYILFVAV